MRRGLKDSGGGKDPTQGLATDLYPFAFFQQLGKVGVVGVRITVPGQFDHSGGDFLGSGIARSAPAVAVGQGFFAALAVRGQQTPELSPAHTQQGYRLAGIDLAVLVAI